MINMSRGEHLQTSNYSGPFADVSNRQNFSCIIMKSNEKVRTNRNSGCKDQSNKSAMAKPANMNFGQRLEEIEADA
jgi:hypothetical protein